MKTKVIPIIALCWIAQLLIVSCKNGGHNEGSRDSEDIEEAEMESLDYYAATHYEPLKYQGKLPETPFFNDCEDIYNSYLLGTTLFSIMEVWWRMEEERPSPDMINAINALSAESLKNQGVRKSAEEMLKAFKNYVTDSTLYMSTDKSVMDGLMDKYYAYHDLISNKYNIYSYVDLDEEEYLKEINRLDDLIPNYSELFQLENTPENLKKIYSMIKEEKDFEKKCGYAEIYAFVGGGYNIDVNIFKEIFEEGKYSHRLFPFWRIWRCTTQLCGDGGDIDYGPSTFAYIPNDYYNKRRRQIALTTLDYLKSHPKDKVAINQYIMLSAMSNLKRFFTLDTGETGIGNGAFEEQYYLGLGAKD